VKGEVKSAYNKTAVNSLIKHNNITIFGCHQSVYIIIAVKWTQNNIKHIQHLKWSNYVKDHKTNSDWTNGGSLLTEY
jgi:hypothetical protein